MCGLAGIVDLRGIEQARVAPLLGRALARLAPRGPDGEGRWFDAHAALGHRRLAVIDLSQAAAQPMARHGGVIVYNGEIYNFAELRAELEAKGHAFESRSDTEVLLAGWKEWGEALLPKLSGMFAFALWLPERAELVLARDRFGKKPLLYHREGAHLAFASDLVALESLIERRLPLDRAALRLLFTLRFVPDPAAILEGVAKLKPGHLARFKDGRLEVRPWYDLGAARLEPYGDEREAAVDLRARFDRAVEARLVADVPLGVFLSGGVDSALVAASMAAQGGTVKSFTVGFADAAPYYEERARASRVAAHLGTRHTEIEVAPRDALDALDAVFAGLDEPFADSSAVPTYLLSRETRRHVTVALSGDGADEVFGGYRKYQGELMAWRYRAIPAPLRKGLIEPLAALLPESKEGALTEGFRRLRRFVAHAGKDAAARQAGWARLLSESELERLFVEPHPAPPIEETVEALREAAGDPDPINRMLACDIALGLASDMLVKVDRMSMANGLEVRSPFLDHRVVECAAAMPGRFKLARGAGKRILKRAFADRLPADVFALPKKGFEIPIARWLTNELEELTRAAIDPVRLKRQGLFRPELPRRWFDELQAGRRDTSEALWTLIAFQAWCERSRRTGEGAQ